MTQNKVERESIPLGTLIFFQNLAPGQQQSPLINHYKSECIDTEEDEKLKQQREDLLSESPPILSFRDAQQKKNFYVAEAKNLQSFCCGSLSPTCVAVLDEVAFSPKDDYVFSAGNGSLYEGSKETIEAALKQNIVEEPFGSSSQQALMTGLKAFDNTIALRGKSAASIEPETLSLSAVKTTNPFDITPKPKE